MSEQITHRAFFGDAEYAFTLTDPMLIELERLSGLGVGVIYSQLVSISYQIATLNEIIRLGLIGAGISPEVAKRLCDAYAVNRPLGEIFPLAFEILEARWIGKTADPAASAA